MRQRVGELAKILGGAKGFGKEAGQFTGGEFEALARLGFGFDAKAPTGTIAAQAATFLERRRDGQGIIQQRLRDEREAERRKAAQQASQTDPSLGTAELDAVIGRAIEGTGVTPERARELVLAEVVKQRKARKGNTVGSRTVFPGFSVPQIEDDARLQAPGFGPTRNVPEIQALQNVMRELVDVLNARGLDTVAPINVYNSTFNGADGAAFERRVRASSAVGAARSLEPAGARR